MAECVAWDFPQIPWPANLDFAVVGERHQDRRQTGQEANYRGTLIAVTVVSSLKFIRA